MRPYYQTHLVDWASRFYTEPLKPFPTTPADRLRARIARIPYFGEPLPPPVYTGYKVGIDWGAGLPSRSVIRLGTMS